MPSAFDPSAPGRHQWLTPASCCEITALPSPLIVPCSSGTDRVRVVVCHQVSDVCHTGVRHRLRVSCVHSHQGLPLDADLRNLYRLAKSVAVDSTSAATPPVQTSKYDTVCLGRKHTFQEGRDGLSDRIVASAIRRFARCHRALSSTPRIIERHSSLTRAAMKRPQPTGITNVDGHTRAVTARIAGVVGACSSHSG